MGIESVDQVNRKLEKLAKLLAKPEVANKAASIALYGRVIKNFDQQGAMDGRWVPLAESTVRQKQKIGKEQMLVRTGHLRSGFVPSHDEHNARVRNEVPYAIYHHEGTSRIPARNLLPSRQATIEIGLKVYKYYVEQWVRQVNS